MKQKLSIVVAAMVVVFVSAFVFQPDPIIASTAFQSQLGELLQRNGYVTSSLTAYSPQQIPLPFYIRWHPRHWTRTNFTQPGMLGFPNRAECYTVTHERSASLDCAIRYLDDRACFISIRSRLASQVGETTALRSALVQQFPGLPIKL